uniref:Remorin C-terminal domain-containing protein n=1 Tax=Ananas comosus var. bracteatus TaxID=296719 RepID=A0A6V7P105_ANACO|nr:unnamed protein product [Ananas comosus var. bracteatus]
MGTEMTPIASKEPSRTGTPMRASTPISSRSSTPGRVRQGGAPADCVEKLENSVSLAMEASSNSLESRAMAWDEAERAKYMARYKREEVKIQAWENHEKRKAEMEMKKIEVKAERMKSRAQEKLANKMASTRRIAEEKRTTAEAKLNERAARTSERADYIRRTGTCPHPFSPSSCPLYVRRFPRSPWTRYIPSSTITLPTTSAPTASPQAHRPHPCRQCHPSS